MKTLLIVFHSLSGGTRQMAEATTLGAQTERGIGARLLPAADTTSADVLGADGYIFATPENLGAMAGRMKEFFDRTYYAALDQINGRPYATLKRAYGLARCTWRGLDHFKTYVWSSVVAYNLVLFARLKPI